MEILRFSLVLRNMLVRHVIEYYMIPHVWNIRSCSRKLTFCCSTQTFMVHLLMLMGNALTYAHAVTIHFYKYVMCVTSCYCRIIYVTMGQVIMISQTLLFAIFSLQTYHLAKFVVDAKKGFVLNQTLSQSCQNIWKHLTHNCCLWLSGYNSRHSKLSMHCWCWCFSTVLCHLIPQNMMKVVRLFHPVLNMVYVNQVMNISSYSVTML